MDTDIKKGVPRQECMDIRWNEVGEEIRRAQEERAANTTLMWAYDSRRLPDEFVDLDQKTFLADPSKRNLCFLPTEILIKICAMVRHFTLFFYKFCRFSCPSWIL